MEENKYFVPVSSVIDLRTGKSVREMIEVSEEEYHEFLKPYAEILVEDFVNKLIKEKDKGVQLHEA